MASATPKEEALLLAEDQDLQEAQESTLHIPVCPEEALKPDDAVGLGVITEGPLDI